MQALWAHWLGCVATQALGTWLGGRTASRCVCEWRHDQGALAVLERQLDRCGPEKLREVNYGHSTLALLLVVLVGILIGIVGTLCGVVLQQSLAARKANPPDTALGAPRKSEVIVQSADLVDGPSSRSASAHLLRSRR